VRILLYPQQLIYGGSQLTALDLATSIHRRGHEVIVYGCDGPLRPAIEQRGFRVELAPDDIGNGRWPSPSSVRRLRALARDERVDLVHTYEYGPFLEALLGPYLLGGVPLVGSIMSMTVPRFMPRSVPLIVGTRQLRDQLVRDGYRSVALIEPPVDTVDDHPDARVPDLRAELGIPRTALLGAIVSRLADMKTNGVELAMRAVEQIADSGTDARLLVVGSGEDEARLRAEADEVNARFDHDPILFAGHLDDPRPAYAAADVSLGMGSSALRGMAFGKASIILGTHRYAELFSPETSGEFLVQGFWGLGDDDVDRAVTKLRAQIESLLDERRRADLGAFAREFVCERFALDVLTDRLERVYDEVGAAHDPVGVRRSNVTATMGRMAWGRLIYQPQKLRSAIGRARS